MAAAAILKVIHRSFRRPRSAARASRVITPRALVVPPFLSGGEGEYDCDRDEEEIDGVHCQEARARSGPEVVFGACTTPVNFSTGRPRASTAVEPITRSCEFA